MAHPTLQLQRTTGNQAVQQWLQANPESLEVTTGTTARTSFGDDFSRIPIHTNVPTRLQTELTVNTPGDMYEQEADRVADQVMHMQEPRLQRACICGGGRPECQSQAEQLGQKKKPLQTKRAHESDTQAPVAQGILDQVLRPSGQPLDTGARAFMEPRFGHDFSRVRIHADASAHAFARQLEARAFTVGSDTFFAASEYQPRTATGQRLLAHELAHVVQQREHVVPMGALQRAPADVVPEPILGRATLVEASEAYADLEMYKYGLRLAGSPPGVKFGEDGPIPEADRKIVQLAFDLAYRAAASPSFATGVGEFKGTMGPQAAQTLPGLSGLSQQKYLDALKSMAVHLADTSNNPLVKSVQAESGPDAWPPTAAFTPVGGNNVYIQAFAIQEGRDALASVILHESFHVAGVPSKPLDKILTFLMEVGVHQFEASVGLPFSQMALKIASIESVEAQGQGLAFTVSVTDPDQVDANIIRIEILDGNRNLVFLEEHPRAKFTERFLWNGLNASGKPTESGMHSLRVVAGAAIYAARDYVLQRAKG